MKKSVSILLVVICLLSCVSLLSGCGNRSARKFDELVVFITDNGVEANGKVCITKKLSELGEVWKDSTTVVSIVYDKSTGRIVMEETTEYDDYTEYYKVTCDKNENEVDAYVTHTFDKRECYYKGYVLKSTFGYANRESAVYEFETNNAPLGESNAKATLGVGAYLVLSHTSFLLRSVNCPVSLNDIGFNAL